MFNYTIFSKTVLALHALIIFAMFKYPQMLFSFTEDGFNDFTQK